ncbi:hypothetical protein SLEP1_g42883 [Rubroshorea leprosula]|uniref:C2H2-type domain-containing protein n=1 Tax=Rubroshorea leprosula TaxID=152421 RepID=A0AAV5LB98_9ROSI|nr:hypothetical protein SLEP1_g42883 [Rubroshorea leprosula]
MTLRVPKDDEAESMDSFLFVCAKCLTTFPSSESLIKHEKKEHGVSSSKSLSKNEKEQGLSSEVFRKHEKTVSKHGKEHGLSPKALSKHEKEHGLPNPVIPHLGHLTSGFVPIKKPRPPEAKAKPPKKKGTSA